jgi:thiol-disulfide isomerase/thioredoxin
MRTFRRGALVVAVFAAIGVTAALSARSHARKTGDWPQGLHAVTAADVVEPIRTRGAPVLVLVFAGWCEECRREIPALDRALASFAATDLRIVAVAVDEDADSYEPFATPHAALRPVRLLPREQDTLVAALQARGASYHRSIPYAAVFDRSGALVRDHWNEQQRVAEITHELSSLTSNTAAPRL